MFNTIFHKEYQYRPDFALKPMTLLLNKVSVSRDFGAFSGTVHLSVFRNLTRLKSLNLSRNHLDENWIKVSVQHRRTRMKLEDKAKVVASVWGGSMGSIICCVGGFASVDLKKGGIQWFLPNRPVECNRFFPIDRGKTASAARN